MARGARSSRGAKQKRGSLALLAEMRDAPLQPIYLLQGKDAFLRDEYLRVIRHKAFGEASDDFNHDRLGWAEADAREILSIAQTLPFMTQRRLVEISDFTRPDARGEELFLAYFEQPAETTTLVFCAESADMRTTFFQRLAKAGALCRTDTPEGRELAQWLHGRAGELGFELTPEAADMLVEMVAPSMGRLNAELEKLLSYVLPEKLAGPEEVRAVVGHSREEMLYRLGDSLSRAPLGETLALLRRMLETEHPVVFVGLLRNLIRRWTFAKALVASGRAGDIARVAGVPPFVAQRLEGQVRSLRSARLRELYTKLLRVDRRLKRTSDPNTARRLLELLLVEVRSAVRGAQKVV